MQFKSITKQLAQFLCAAATIASLAHSASAAVVQVTYNNTPGAMLMTLGSTAGNETLTWNINCTGILSPGFEKMGVMLVYNYYSGPRGTGTFLGNGAGAYAGPFDGTVPGNGIFPQSFTTNCAAALTTGWDHRPAGTQSIAYRYTMNGMAVSNYGTMPPLGWQTGCSGTSTYVTDGTITGSYAYMPR